MRTRVKVEPDLYFFIRCDEEHQKQAQKRWVVQEKVATLLGS